MAGYKLTDEDFRALARRIMTGHVRVFETEQEHKERKGSKKSAELASVRLEGMYELLDALVESEVNVFGMRMKCTEAINEVGKYGSFLPFTQAYKIWFEACTDRITQIIKENVR